MVPREPGSGLPIGPQAHPGPHLAPRSTVPMVQEPALGELAAEPLLRAHLLPGFLAPTLPCTPELAGESLLGFVSRAAVCQERREDVHLRPVGSGGLPDLLGRLEALSQPFVAPTYDPR